MKAQWRRLMRNWRILWDLTSQKAEWRFYEKNLESTLISRGQTRESAHSQRLPFSVLIVSRREGEDPTITLTPGADLDANCPGGKFWIDGQDAVEFDASVRKDRNPGHHLTPAQPAALAHAMQRGRFIKFLVLDQEGWPCEATFELKGFAEGLRRMHRTRKLPQGWIRPSGCPE